MTPQSASIRAFAQQILASKQIQPVDLYRFATAVANSTDGLTNSVNALMAQIAALPAPTTTATSFGLTGIAPTVGKTGAITYLNPLVYGAAADGITDDTAIVQSVVSSLKTGEIIDGLGQNFLVSTIKFPSFVGVQNFRFVEKASSTQFDSPVTVDGTVTPVTDLWFKNIFVNGQRSLQTGMDSQPTENGGRHGFRFIGNIARMSLENCRAFQCATDGFCFFSSTAKPSTDADATLCFQYITMINCWAYQCRRHGASADSIYQWFLQFVRTVANGTTINRGATQGDQGAMSGGITYGNGWDFEGYGVGSCINHLTLQDCVSQQNAQYPLSFFDIATGNDAGFSPRQNIKIEGGDYGVGVNSLPGNQHSIVFSSTTGNASITPALYQNIRIVGPTAADIILTSVNGVSIVSPIMQQYETNATWLQRNYAENITISNPIVTPGMSVYQQNSTTALGMLLGGVEVYFQYGSPVNGITNVPLDIGSLAVRQQGSGKMTLYSLFQPSIPSNAPLSFQPVPLLQQDPTGNSIPARFSSPDGLLKEGVIDLASPTDITTSNMGGQEFVIVKAVTGGFALQTLSATDLVAALAAALSASYAAHPHYHVVSGIATGSQFVDSGPDV